MRRIYPKLTAEKNWVKSEAKVATRVFLDVVDQQSHEHSFPIELTRQGAVAGGRSQSPDGILYERAQSIELGKNVVRFRNERRIAPKAAEAAAV